MIFLNLLSIVALASSDINEIDFPYCLNEFHGSIERELLLLDTYQVSYEFQCQMHCMSNGLCKTFSFATDGECLLYTSGLYDAMHNLRSDLTVKTKSAFRCMFECNRITNSTQCEESVACKWTDEQCVTSCENFSNENIKIEECDVQSVQCGGILTCSNSSVIGTALTDISCIGDNACLNLQISTMNTVECKECVGGLIDSVDTIVAEKMQNVDIISTNNVICHDCVFDEADVLQVGSVRSVAEYGLRSIPASMQAELQSLECVANHACNDIDVHVNRLTCQGPSTTASCSDSTFTSLGEDSVVRCIGENACAGSAFDGFANVYCIGVGSCENTLFMNTGAFWCFVEDGTERCNSALPRENFHQCIHWTGEECLTSQPSAMPTSPDPTLMPTVAPSSNPTIFIAVEAATRSCQVNEWYDMHVTSCFSCPDGMEPTHTKLDCAQCAGNSAGKGGSCDECMAYFYFPSSDGKSCEINIVTIVLVIVSSFACCLSCKLWRSGSNNKSAESKAKKNKKDSKREPKKEGKNTKGKILQDEEEKKEKKRKSMTKKAEKRNSLTKKSEKRNSLTKKSEKRKSIEKGSKKKRKDSGAEKQHRVSDSEEEEFQREAQETRDLEKRLSEHRSSLERKSSFERPRSSFRKTSPASREHRSSLERPRNSFRKPSPAARISVSMNRRGEGESKYRPHTKNWEQWDHTQVGRFFCSHGMRSVGDAFEGAHINGTELKQLSYADLCDLGFRNEEIRRFDDIMQTHLREGSRC